MEEEDKSGLQFWSWVCALFTRGETAPVSGHPSRAGVSVRHPAGQARPRPAVPMLRLAISE